MFLFVVQCWVNQNFEGLYLIVVLTFALLRDFLVTVIDLLGM